MNKIKALMAKYPKAVYEIKSFLVTFFGVFVAVSGISEATNLQYIFDNYQMLLGAASIAATRTLVIFIMKIVNLDYRNSTVKYK